MKDFEVKKTRNVEKNNKNYRFFSGLTGENIALNKFKELGFELVKSRYKTTYGEIDLIVEDSKNKIIVFVEVKRRKNIYDYSTVVSQKQWHRIYNSSSIFLSENYEKYKDYFIRYDCVICFTNCKNIIHIENIFPTEK